MKNKVSLLLSSLVLISLLLAACGSPDLMVSSEEETDPPAAAVAEVTGLVTDGTFFPDGKRVLLRTYGTATVYTFPGFAPIGTVRLPQQRQGEGISVSRTGRVLISTEGAHSDVLQVSLPAALTDPSATPTAAPADPSAGAPGPTNARPLTRTVTQWGWTVLVAAGVGLLGYLTLRGSRLRGPRKR